MLTRQEREEIRKCIGKAERYTTGHSKSRDVLGTLDQIALVDTPRLLDALDKVEQEIEGLRVLVRKLHKIVNLAALTNCDHKCFTKETQSQLFALLEQAQAVVEHK